MTASQIRSHLRRRRRSKSEARLLKKHPPPHPSRRATHGRAAAPDGAMAAQWQLKVAVESLRPQDVVEIGVTPETTWEEAKLAACQVAYAEPVDVATRRLLFRGRERSPTATLGRDGVRPGHKLMLVESDESKRERARAAQEAQMEQIRAERQRHHASSVQCDGDGGTVGDGGAVGDGAQLAERCRAEVDTACLLYTSPSPRDQRGSRMPSSA